MEAENVSVFQFPPGFKFHPSDEELITHYLLNKLKSHPLPADVIAEIELYNFSPWELPKKALFGKDEWFFFTPRDRKYPNGERPNRTAASGYWKATGIDKPILTDGSRKIGVKKALVFYTGRSPKGVKTNWIMSEYRVPETSRSSKLKGSMRLDDWVLCRVQQKGNMSKKIWEDRGSPVQELMNYFTRIEELPSTQAYSHTNIITELRNRGCQALSTVLSGQHLPQVENTSSEILQDRNRESEGSLYEYGANNADSVCDIIRNMSRGKFSEEYKGLPQSNTLNTNNLNFDIHRQYAPDIFSSNPFDIISSLQGLDESAKVSTNVQQAFREKQQF